MLTLPEYLMLIFSLITIICMRKLLAIDPPPLLNIYRQPGHFYWGKLVFIYIILKLRKLKSVFVNYEELDKAQVLSDSEKPIDAVYFNCANEEKDAVIVGIARRKPPHVDGFLYIRLEKYGLLTSPALPNTWLKQMDNEEGFSAAGIRIIPIIANTKWEVKYAGEMFDAHGKSFKVELNAEWNSNKESFNFDHDMDAYLMAAAMAKEQWSVDYFKCVQFIHQTHYEQPGALEGTVIIDGDSQMIKLSGLRDHTFGHHRDWRYFHRYVMHLVTLDNGDQMNIGVISMPLAFSTLHIGYYYNALHNKIYPLQGSDLKLYQYGENGKPTREYAFTFSCDDKKYLMEVQGFDTTDFFISEDWEVRIIEMFSTFRVNGVQGWGTVEWQYRNMSGRAAIK